MIDRHPQPTLRVGYSDRPLDGLPGTHMWGDADETRALDAWAADLTDAALDHAWDVTVVANPADVGHGTVSGGSPALWAQVRELAADRRCILEAYAKEAGRARDAAMAEATGWVDKLVDHAATVGGYEEHAPERFDVVAWAADLDVPVHRADDDDRSPFDSPRRPGDVRVDGVSALLTDDDLVELVGRIEVEADVQVSFRLLLWPDGDTDVVAVPQVRVLAA